MSKLLKNSVYRRFLIGALLFAILAPTMYYLYYSFVIYKFTVVSEGEVYRSAKMPPYKLKSVIAKYKIKTIIDLRKPGKSTEKERTLVTNARAIYKNIHSRQIPRDDAISDFLSVMSRPETFPVLIHCEHGQGRAPLFSAIYLMEFKCLSNKEVLQSANSIINLFKFGNFDQNSEKGKYLHEYKHRLNNCDTVNSDINATQPPT